MPNLFDIKVSGDIAGVTKMPRILEIAFARGVDSTGTFAQDEIIRELDEELVLRGGWFKPKTRFGINFIPTQRGNQEAFLYTRADWLLEEEGFNAGLKKPEDGDHLADPEDPVTRGPITRKFPRTQKAGVLLLNASGRGSLINSKKGFGRNAGHFKIKSKTTGDELVFQRVRLDKAGEVRRNKFGVPIRGRVNGKGETTLILKHILKRRVKVPTPRIFQNTATRTYRVYLPEHVNRQLRRGFLTAKL